MAIYFFWLISIFILTGGLMTVPKNGPLVVTNDQEPWPSLQFLSATPYSHFQTVTSVKKLNSSCWDQDLEERTMCAEHDVALASVQFSLWFYLKTNVLLLDNHLDKKWWSDPFTSSLYMVSTKYFNCPNMTSIWLQGFCFNANIHVRGLGITQF